MIPKIHVIPTDDAKPHSLNINCWCNPYIAKNFVMHNKCSNKTLRRKWIVMLCAIAGLIALYVLYAV